LFHDAWSFINSLGPHLATLHEALTQWLRGLRRGFFFSLSWSFVWVFCLAVESVDSRVIPNQRAIDNFAIAITARMSMAHVEPCNGCVRRLNSSMCVDAFSAPGKKNHARERSPKNCEEIAEKHESGQPLGRYHLESFHGAGKGKREGSVQE
jgi:hypothetical protein